MSTRLWIALLATVITSVVFIHSCTSDRELLDPEILQESDILPHIQELSSDAYFGRMPFGPGDQKTVDLSLIHISEPRDRTRSRMPSSA